MLCFEAKRHVMFIANNMQKKRFFKFELSNLNKQLAPKYAICIEQI